MHLLVVEDDLSIAEPLCAGLLREGFSVQHVATGAEATSAGDADLVLLDLGLPDLDGRAVCRALRAESNVPIIVVTARSDEIDRVTLLELGADDYVVKPFGFRELVARIGAVLRRTGASETSGASSTASAIDLGWLRLDRRTRRVTVDDDEVALTPKEFDLLAFLAADVGTIHLRDEIIRDVWDENWWGSTKTLDVHIASLRKKIGATSIVTVRGVGFGLAEHRDAASGER
ncbi:MAG: response regulator transcription factor [Ilumatobacter sp.]|uniref:response regulator transcription factor n=1 Tax=Ilumatobacter sp. TaxID=1967498 RepID=UPI00391A4BF6